MCKSYLKFLLYLLGQLVDNLYEPGITARNESSAPEQGLMENYDQLSETKKEIKIARCNWRIKEVLRKIPFRG